MGLGRQSPHIQDVSPQGNTTVAPSTSLPPNVRAALEEVEERANATVNMFPPNNSLPRGFN